MRKLWMAVPAVAFLLASRWAAADIVDSSATGFTVKQSHTIQAAPQEVYRRIFRIGEWWNSQHSFSGDAHNLTIEEKAGGCFCEKLPGGGAIKHMELVYFVPGKTIVMRGAMGPFASMATEGAVEIQLSAAGGGTRIDITHALTGYVPGGLNPWAERVDFMWKDQFTRLKNYIEHGDPAAK